MSVELRTRECRTHGHVQVERYGSSDQRDADECPVPTYMEEPCGEPLGPERVWAPTDAARPARAPATPAAARTVNVKLALDGADAWDEAEIVDALCRAIAGESLDGGAIIDEVLEIRLEDE